MQRRRNPPTRKRLTGEPALSEAALIVGAVLFDFFDALGTEYVFEYRGVDELASSND